MIRQVAFLSIHTSPMERPGSGDAGGMNVYVNELARTLARRGVAVDVFTRRSHPDLEPVVPVGDGYRVIHVDTGLEGAGTVGLAETVGSFAEGVIKFSYLDRRSYEVVHSHYWLSGWAGVLVKEALHVPLANSFHTLGRIKDALRHPLDPPVGLLRIRTEHGVVAQSDCVIASTPAESRDLLEHYDAAPERLCISPPGVDHSVFTPGDRELARSRLGLGAGPLILFAGRLQRLKGIDVALRALSSPVLGGVRLLVVGGPSGVGGDQELKRTRALASELGLADRVVWCPPVAHEELVDCYRGADVVVVPSRAESFGMVAVEAQAAGRPVVASAVGGLRYAVDDGRSGILVAGHDPADYAVALASILRDPSLADSMQAAGVDHARRFNWETSADRMLELYDGILP